MMGYNSLLISFLQLLTINNLLNFSPLFQYLVPHNPFTNFSLVAKQISKLYAFSISLTLTKLIYSRNLISLKLAQIFPREITQNFQRNQTLGLRGIST